MAQEPGNVISITLTREELEWLCHKAQGEGKAEIRVKFEKAGMNSAALAESCRKKIAAARAAY